MATAPPGAIDACLHFCALCKKRLNTLSQTENSSCNKPRQKEWGDITSLGKPSAPSSTNSAGLGRHSEVFSVQTSYGLTWAIYRVAAFDIPVSAFVGGGEQLLQDVIQCFWRPLYQAATSTASFIPFVFLLSPLSPLFPCFSRFSSMVPSFIFE